MRRALLVLVATEGALGALVACGAFGGSAELTPSDASAADASLDTGPSADAPGAFDAASDEGGSCVGFEAGPALPMTGTECNGGAADLSTDPMNCGGCGHACIVGTCTSGLCDPDTLIPTSSATVVAMDPTSIYYFSGEPGVLYKSPRGTDVMADAAIPLAAVADTEYAPKFYGLAMDDASVYATTFAYLEVAPVMTLPSPFTPIASLNSAYPKLVVTTDLYLANTDGNQIVIRYKEDGGIAQTIAEDGATDVVTTPDNRYIFFVATNLFDAGAPTSIDGSVLTRGTLFRLATATHALTPMVIFNTPNNELAIARPRIAADNSNVYFADGVDGSIFLLGADTNGFVAPTLVSQAHGRYISEIAVDATTIYFTAAYDNTDSVFAIQSVAKCGGPESTYLAHGSSTSFDYRPAGLFVDDQFIYWGGLNGVYRVAK